MFFILGYVDGDGIKFYFESIDEALDFVKGQSRYYLREDKTDVLSTYLVNTIAHYGDENRVEEFVGANFNVDDLYVLCKICDSIEIEHGFNFDCDTGDVIPVIYLKR